MLTQRQREILATIEALYDHSWVETGRHNPTVEEVAIILDMRIDHLRLYLCQLENCKFIRRTKEDEIIVLAHGCALYAYDPEISDKVFFARVIT